MLKGRVAAARNIRQPKVSAAHRPHNKRHVCLSPTIHGDAGPKPALRPGFFLSVRPRPLIGADVNATILEALAQPGQYQVGTRGRGKAGVAPGLRAAKYFGASLNFRERIFVNIIESQRLPFNTGNRFDDVGFKSDN